MSDIRIMHIADSHLGSALSSLPYDKCAMRQKETVYTFIQSVKSAEDFDILLLSGDIFDRSEVSASLIDLFLESIEALDGIPVFYACGNHDSYYTDVMERIRKFAPQNLHIFPPDSFSCVTLDKLHCSVYGASFSSPSCSEPMFPSLPLPDDDFVNILCMHADLIKGNYNYLDVASLAKSEFDYVALGHVHSFGIFKSGNTVYAYPGITEGRGFDECGEKGYISGTISKGACSLSFVPVSKRRYIDEKVDISEFANEYELSELLMSLSMGEGNICRFTLVGENNFGRNIDCGFLEKQIDAYHCICIDETKSAINPEDYISDTDFRGICASKALDMIKNSQSETHSEKIKKAFNLLAELFE